MLSSTRTMVATKILAAVAATGASTMVFAHHPDTAGNAHVLEHMWQIAPVVLIAAIAAWFVVRKLRA